MKEIYIDERAGSRHIFILENQRLSEYHIERGSKSLVGNIYRARVENVLRGMDSAFLDIGQGKNVYLQLKDALIEEDFRSKEGPPCIDQILKEGDQVLVQVTRDPVGDKGARVTRQLSLSGNYLVLTPYYLGINISRKIKNKGERRRLKELGESLGKNLGLIFRTAAQGMDREILEAEYRELSSIFVKLEKEKNFLPTPKLIYRDQGLLYRFIRDRLDEDLNIIVNREETYREVLDMEGYLGQSLGDRIRLDRGFRAEYKETIENGIQEALGRKVRLKSGGYIVIDETEALTAIDVNTGKFVGDLSYEKTIVETNREAAVEIARQISLRNLAGIIIIDFIDMKEENREGLLSLLENSFKNDKNPANIIGLTKLGLVEITRKRTGPSLQGQIREKCPKCQGSGQIRK